MIVIGIALYNFYAEKRMKTSDKRDTWLSQPYRGLEELDIQSGADTAQTDISTTLLIDGQDIMFL